MAVRCEPSSVRVQYGEDSRGKPAGSSSRRSAIAVEVFLSHGPGEVNVPVPDEDCILCLSSQKFVRSKKMMIKGSNSKIFLSR